MKSRFSAVGVLAVGLLFAVILSGSDCGGGGGGSGDRSRETGPFGTTGSGLSAAGVTCGSAQDCTKRGLPQCLILTGSTTGTCVACITDEHCAADGSQQCKENKCVTKEAPPAEGTTDTGYKPPAGYTPPPPAEEEEK